MLARRSDSPVTLGETTLGGAIPSSLVGVSLGASMPGIARILVRSPGGFLPAPPPPPALGPVATKYQTKVLDKLATGVSGWDPTKRYSLEAVDLLELNYVMRNAWIDVYESSKYKFRWAGLASFVYANIGMMVGYFNTTSVMLDTLKIFLTADEESNSITDADLRTFIFWLSRGSLEIYLRLYWQHLAYSDGGLATIDAAGKEGSIGATERAMWKTLDDGWDEYQKGLLTNDTSLIASSMTTMWRATDMIFAFEQEDIIQENLIDPIRAAFLARADKLTLVDLFKRLTTLLLPSAIPGGSSFRSWSRRQPGRPLFDDLAAREGYGRTNQIPAFKKIEDTKGVAEITRLLENRRDKKVNPLTLVGK